MIGLRVIGLLGVVVALIGAALLVLPVATRRGLRLVFGVRLAAGRVERLAAWLLVCLGLFIALVARFAR